MALQVATDDDDERWYTMPILERCQTKKKIMESNT